MPSLRGKTGCQGRGLVAPAEVVPVAVGVIVLVSVHLALPRVVRTETSLLLLTCHSFFCNLLGKRKGKWQEKNNFKGTWKTGSVLMASGIAATVGSALVWLSLSAAAVAALLSTISKKTFLTTGACNTNTIKAMSAWNSPQWPQWQQRWF